MSSYVSVPAGFGGTDISVVAGLRLLAGVREGPGLAAHRRLWRRPERLTTTELIELTRALDVRGRGGAGFPFARKLETTVQSGKRGASVVVNAAEGEPGSAKDSALLLTAPHLVLDGAALVARALDVTTVHVVVAGERPAAAAAIESAIGEVESGIGFTVHATSGGFVGGQARAVLELLSGRPNLPVTAWTPEAVNGLRGRPTLLSNAETFAQVAVAAALGVDEYTRYGTAEQPGTTLVTVGGDGSSGVVLEVPFGVSLAEVLEHCGFDPGAPLVVGGYHGTWLAAADVGSRRIARADLAAAGATIGAGVLLPVDRGACPVTLTARVVAYLAGQSARRCGPCLNGLPALADACTALATGHAGPEVMTRIDSLVGVLPGRGACAHPDGTVRLVRSLVKVFPYEVEAHVHGGCSYEEVAP